MTDQDSHPKDPIALILGRARIGLSPSSAERSRVLAHLGSAAFGHSPTDTHPSLAPEALSGKALSGFAWRTLATGVVGGALVGFGSGYLVAAGDIGADRAAHHSTSSAEMTRRTPKPSTRTAPSLTAGVTLEQLEDEAKLHQTEVQDANIRDGERQEDSKAKPLAAQTNQQAEPTFYQELSYVRRAQSALQKGNPALALGLMKSLDEIQPLGALGAERKVTQVLALCQLGRSDEAAATARLALKRDQTGIYRRRLESSCAGVAVSDTVADAVPSAPLESKINQ